MHDYYSGIMLQGLQAGASVPSAPPAQLVKAFSFKPFMASLDWRSQMSTCIEAPTKEHERRPDSAVLAHVKHRLKHSAYPPVRRVRVDEQEGVVSLYGDVSSFYLKQVAQETVAKVTGILLI